MHASTIANLIPLWPYPVVCPLMVQDSVSRTAVRSAADESLMSKEELAMLHRIFYDGCMKVGCEQNQRKAERTPGTFIYIYIVCFLRDRVI